MLLKLAREHGCTTLTGVDMFVRQAALQFKLYTGQERPRRPDDETVEAQAGAAPRRMRSSIPTRGRRPTGLGSLGGLPRHGQVDRRAAAGRPATGRPFLDADHRDRGHGRAVDPRRSSRSGRTGVPRLGGARCSCESSSQNIPGAVLATGGGAVLREANRRVAPAVRPGRLARGRPAILARRLRSRRPAEPAARADRRRRPRRDRRGAGRPDAALQEVADVTRSTPTGCRRRGVADEILELWPRPTDRAHRRNRRP